MSSSTVSAGTEFRLPDVGEGLTEAEIVTWRVAPGDTVGVNDPLADIETAKSLVELSSPHAGTVAELCAAEGDTVPVGSVLLRFTGAHGSGPSVGATGGTGSAGARDAADLPAEEPAVLVGPGPRAEPSRRRRRARDTGPGRPHTAAGAATGGTDHPDGRPGAGNSGSSPNTGTGTGTNTGTGTGAGTGTGTGAGTGTGGATTAAGAAVAGDADAPAPRAPVNPAPPPAAPAVRRLARELGIPLASVTATGPGGRVLREDVLGHFTSGLGPAVTAPDGEIRTPIRGVRRATAEAVTRSAFTAPHVTEFLDVDVTGTVELVARLREDPRLAGSRVTPLLVVARAVLAAVRAHPEINATWSAETGEIVQHASVNLGIAAATDRGLIVPNIAAADRLDLPGLARALDALVETARAGRTPVSDLTGGTVTVTNIGVFGVDAATPILNPGEAAILCLGAFGRRPWVVGDDVVPRWTTRLSLSFDHRLVDGELGSRVLARIGAVLTDPTWELALA
ncbi:dihydrolipoamide acetyltransferase family protein [Pseudonocardia sp. NPDC049635]|uniref:dihydrolipoamide acetyltransferase family protein n=1 Tax=Pseudonocardia sp. NPDC049635 TaxID=3155506 RepID=UPI0033C10812